MDGRFIEFLLVLAGLALSPFLFRRFPTPGEQDRSTRTNADAGEPDLSVVIPARNEEASLPLLLSDLAQQTVRPREILVIDDESLDGTARVAREGGATVLSLAGKPEGWVGKSWACQRGADAAAGEWLLFLDADVRLGPDAVERLAAECDEDGETLSVQPWHAMERPHEQLSLFFNLVQAAANGLCLPKGRPSGLAGPVILIRRLEYGSVGGHEAIRGSIVDDMALGERLRRAGRPFRVLLGDRGLSYRMYRDGLRTLLQGFVKNQSAGAARIPWDLLLATFLWITSCTSVPYQWIRALAGLDLAWLVVYSVLYPAWVLELRRIARRFGTFGWPTLAAYPLALLAFHGVFVVSLAKRVLRRPVTWKGRRIRPGR